MIEHQDELLQLRARIVKLEAALREVDALVDSGEIYASELKRIIRAALAKEPPRWMPTHRHYKGDLYRFLFVAQHSETREDMAIYENDRGQFWARPLAMFNDTLPDGRKRFTAIEDPPR